MSVPFMENNPFYRKLQETSACVLLPRTLSHGYSPAARETQNGKHLDQQIPALDKIGALFTKQKIGRTAEQLYQSVWVQLCCSNIPQTSEAQNNKSLVFTHAACKFIMHCLCLLLCGTVQQKYNVSHICNLNFFLVASFKNVF